MESNPVGANLARLRVDRGLTQAALAERAGVSRVAVGQAERGDVVPRTRTLLDLARALGTTFGDLVTPVRPLRSVRFRAQARMKGREQVLAEVSKWLDSYRMLERMLDDRRPFGFASVVRRRGDAEPEAVARKARRAIAIDGDTPIPDICWLLDDHGVKVHLMDKKRESFFGLSVGPNDGGPAVVVNTWNRISVERWIFTAAHELGHLLLHSDQYDPEATEHPDSSEKEADRFAGEFLMPEAAFARAWDATLGRSFVTRVLGVKRMFRVSYRTVLYRLVATHRATRDVWQFFQVEHQRRFGRTLRVADEPQPLTESDFAWRWRRKDEPAGLTEHDFLGDRLRRMVRLALERDLLSLGRAAEVMGMHLEDVREWVVEWAQ